MDNSEEYKSLISDVIAKQTVILGPDIAVMKARSVESLEVDDNGQVTNIKGDPSQALQQLVDSYFSLSGQILTISLTSVFTKYPSLDKGE